MKIALLLRGIAHDTSYFSHRKVRRLIDYNLTLDSLYKNIISDNEVDIYLHTWKTNDLDINHFLDTYTPKAYKIDDMPPPQNNHRRTAYYGCNTSIKSVLQLFLDNCGDTEYDYIILTRYDLLYHKPLSFYNLKSKTSYLMTSSHATFEDNFCILTKDIIPIYIKTIEGYMCFSHHKSIERILPYFKNFIFDNLPIKYYNDFYQINWIQF